MAARLDSLRQHQAALLDELDASEERELFPLRLRDATSTRRWGLRLERSGKPETLSQEEFFNQTSPKPLVITGDPGSGKTTLLERACLERLHRSEISFFLRMSLWNPGQSIAGQLGRNIDPGVVGGTLEKPSTWVFLDALDEAPSSSLDDAFKAVLAFCDEFPAARVVASARGTQIPAWSSSRFVVGHLLPLSRAQVNEALTAAQSVWAAPIRTPLDQVRDLCRNPLMLSMVQEILLSGDTSVLEISAASQLYDRFIDYIDAREWGKRPTEDATEKALRAGLNLRLLAMIAWRLTETRTATAVEADVGEWFADVLADPQWKPWWAGSTQPSPTSLLRVIGSRAPLKTFPSPTGGLPRFGFMHPTFRDAFAGRHLRTLLADSPPAQLIVTLATERDRQYWPAITFLAGSEAPSGAASRDVLDGALALKQQDLLVLACRCLDSSWVADPKDIGDVLITVLDAFKNWGKAFDYDLMRASHRLVDHLHPAFPPRLRRDLLYFIDKYAEYVPRHVGDTPLPRLLEMLSDPDADTAANALFSLARHRFGARAERKRVAQAIERHLPDWPVLVFDQAIAALADLEEPAALPTLRSIVDNRDAPQRSRAFAANGVAKTGTLADIDLLARFLLDHDVKYRDSASWSLQKLTVRVAKEERNDPATRSRVIEIYMRGLARETSDEAGRYAKGNILYSLGVLQADNHVRDLESYLPTQTDPYVIEDGLLALGLLRDEQSAPVIRPYLRSDDPAIRLKAAEALATLEAISDAEVSLLQSDEYRICRHFAESLGKPPKVTHHPEDDVVLKALQRPALTTDATRVVLRISQTEREAFTTVCSREVEAGALAAMPTFLGDGPVQEVRFVPKELAALKSSLRKG